MADTESSIRERLDRLVALESCKHVTAAQTTAEGALLGIEKELAKAPVALSPQSRTGGDG